MTNRTWPASAGGRRGRSRPPAARRQSTAWAPLSLRVDRRTSHRNPHSTGSTFRRTAPLHRGQCVRGPFARFPIPPAVRKRRPSSSRSSRLSRPAVLSDAIRRNASIESTSTARGRDTEALISSDRAQRKRLSRGSVIADLTTSKTTTKTPTSSASIATRGSSRIAEHSPAQCAGIARSTCDGSGAMTFCTSHVRAALHLAGRRFLVSSAGRVGSFSPAGRNGDAPPSPATEGTR